MIEISLTATRRLRAWFGELPEEALTPAVGTVRGMPSAATTSALHQRSAAIELYMPTTTRAYYALVGGTLIPSNQVTSTVEAQWTDRLLPTPPWTLCGREGHRGLSLEHAESVVSTPLPAGIAPVAGLVSVTHGVVTDVGTVPVVVKTVTRILLTVLFEPGIAESDERLRALALQAIGEGILLRAAS